MKDITTACEIAIFEAFQKTEAYKTVTKGADVYPYFKKGFIAGIEDKKDPLGEYFRDDKSPMQKRMAENPCGDCRQTGGYHHEDCKHNPF